MIKSQITLKQLEAFASVIDTGTFRAAAISLGTTQPNISSRISALETALDTTLLYRDAGSLRLTERGQKLLVMTRDVLRAGEALLEVAEKQDLIIERLRLGVTELVACTWLQAFLRLVRLEYPNLRVELEVDLSRRIDERLREGQIDLAIQNAPFEFKTTGEQPLAEEPYIWVANTEIAKELASGTSVERFFEKAVLTHGRDTSAGRALRELAKSRKYDPGKIIHSSALSACLPMVREGLGVALLPQSLMSTEINSGQLQSLKSDWVVPPLSFFARYNTESAPRFIAKACDIAASIRPATP